MKEFLEKMINNNPGFSAYLDEALRHDKVMFTRVIFLATLLMYLLFIIVDQYSLQQNRDVVLIIRCVVIAYLLFSFIASFNQDFLLQHYGQILVGFSIMSGGGIELMILISDPDELAFYTYFAGLMMVTIGVFTWTYLNSTVSLLVSLFFILFYLIIFVLVKNNTAVAINHVAFLMGAVVIGLLSDIVVKQFLFRQYKMQKRLQDILLGGDVGNEQMMQSESGIQNHHQFTQALQQSLEDAFTTNLALTLNCVQLPFSSTFKPGAVNQTINRILNKVLPARSIILTDEKVRYYYAYLLRNEDREQVSKNNQLIMSLLSTLIPDIGRIGFGNVIFYQETHNAVELLSKVDRVIRFNDDRSSVQADYHQDEPQTTLNDSNDNGQDSLSHNVTPIRPLKNS